ncbi:membrane protein insertase YidC [Candidatus Peregrinibacteria bacterium]|nr:membrane protein insertase YidC [Candidatus Peregrinibacteria bacterium]
MERFNKILKNVLVFLVIFLAVNYIMGLFINKDEPTESQPGTIIFTTTDNEYSRREKIAVKITNNTDKTIIIPNECPGEPFKVLRFENNAWVEKNANPDINCENTKPLELQPGKKTTIAYTNWNNALFSEMGRFKIEFGELASNEFLVVKEGIFRQLMTGLFYRPIYNALIFLIRIVPGHDLGFAIILLTIIIRTILLMPSQKSMRAQKRMQELQPRLEKIKEKYKGDQQKIATETMALWKETKINPFSSCLPLLLQMPFLIALFYVIQNGLNPDNTYMLYTEYSGFAFKEIDVNFLGILDLTKANIYVLPLIVGALQFAQMKLATGKKIKQQGNEMAMATNMMTYVLPVMIAVFTASLPAGVGIYWAASTIYGIVQQLIINRSKDAGKDSNEPTVKVIEN